MVLKQTIRHLIQQPILMVFLLVCQLYAHQRDGIMHLADAESY